MGDDGNGEGWFVDGEDLEELIYGEMRGLMMGSEDGFDEGGS